MKKSAEQSTSLQSQTKLQLPLREQSSIDEKRHGEQQKSSASASTEHHPQIVRRVSVQAPQQSTSSVSRDAMMSSFERELGGARHVLFWKRRCQTKDTLVQRLQAIISEQKTMLTRIGAFTTKSSSSKQPDKITRGWRIPGHKASFTHNAEDDDERGSSRRKGYRYGRFDKDDTKLDRHARSRRTRDTSHVLLDIPGGVHGNVELNLSGLLLPRVLKVRMRKIRDCW